MDSDSTLRQLTELMKELGTFSIACALVVVCCYSTLLAKIALRLGWSCNSVATWSYQYLEKYSRE